MTTALAEQLARIRSKSTNALDLKAQKRAHSQSLLFDARTAATQNFETLYQICYEGYEELCVLDASYRIFAASLFGEQSKQQDRTQMTTTQNDQLNTSIEDFLRLVGSRLLLKPALKAVEWLVRRFRAHEYNTQCLVFTFLPYHGVPIFPALLSLLPPQLPQTLSFLHPYIHSLACPPHHTVAFSFSNRRSLLSALCVYVLECSRMGCQYPFLISFWSSVSTEACASMLEQAYSAKRDIHRQNQEDVIRFFLPFISTGLTMGDVSDLRVGCYMLLTIMASHADMEDSVIFAFMESVTTKWKTTSHAGLICLSVLAQQLHDPELPQSVFKAVTALDTLEDDLLTLHRTYKVSTLTLGIVLGLLSVLAKARDGSVLPRLRKLMENGLMDEEATIQSLRALRRSARALESEKTTNSNVHGSLADLLLRLAESDRIGENVRAVIQSAELEAENNIGTQRNLTAANETMDNGLGMTVDMNDYRTSGERNLNGDYFNDLTRRIPTKTAYEISFLSHSDSYVFDSLADAFSAVSASPEDTDRFSDLLVLRKSLGMTEPLFLSFFIRVWCGHRPVAAHSAALRTVSAYIAKEPLKADVQILFPYLLYALADESLKIRAAAKDLALELLKAYTEATDGGRNATDLPLLGQDQIYGPGDAIKILAWLSVLDAYHFLAHLLIPGLEECMLDQNHVVNLLSVGLAGLEHKKTLDSASKELTTTLRQGILAYLCSHTTSTPLLNVKLFLLQMLARIGRVGNVSRGKMLLPLLSAFIKKSQTELEGICQRDGLDLLLLMEHILEIISPNDKASMEILRNIVGSVDDPHAYSVRTAAFHRMRTIWNSIKQDTQVDLATMLLKEAIMSSSNDVGNLEAGDTLRSLPLSTAILYSFLKGLSAFALNPRNDGPSASKRRRTNREQSSDPAALNSTNVLLATKHATLVLEIIESSSAERHPALISPLFCFLSDLQQFKDNSDVDISYLQVLTMDSILAMVKNTRKPLEIQKSYSLIRTDVLVDCIRIAESPQVRKAALLLLSALASHMPESVLNSLMPIFTFMGTNILERNDDHSAYVVRQTMESVIPRLTHSLQGHKDGALLGISGLLLSFAAAFEHIPSQRRLDLFTLLTDQIGPSEYLFALLIIMMDKYPGNRKILQFATDLTRRYNPLIRLSVILKYLDTVIDARNAKPQVASVLLVTDQDRNVEDAVINLLPLVSALLRDEDMISKTNVLLQQESKDLEAVYACHAKVLEAVFQLSAQSMGKTRLSLSCLEILDASLGLMPLANLVPTFRDLLEHTDDIILRQALLSFDLRLRADQLELRSAQTACLTLLGQLVSVIARNSDVQIRRLAVVCIDRIAKKLGKRAIATVVDTAWTIAGEKCLQAGESIVRAAALRCLATVVEVSVDLFIPLLPMTTPTALGHLEFSIREDSEDEDQHNAACTFLSALLLYMPWSVTADDLERLLRVCYESANAELGVQCNTSRVGLLELAAKQVDAKACFKSLGRTWSSAMTEGPLAVKEYLSVLRLAIDRHPKHIIAMESDTLIKLFIQLFDFRRIQLSPPTEDSYVLEEIDETESAVSDCAIAMVHKLNDATFRPLFLQVTGWASPSSSSGVGNSTIYRLTAVYTFVYKFFDRLKSIVTSYAALILEDSARLLKSLSPGEDNSFLLWRRVIVTLHKIFEHDQDDFFQNPDNFSPITNPLLSQLSFAGQLSMLPELIPAIVELAVATNASDHHNEINTTVLAYLRSNDPAVRLAAVQCERALTDRLGEEWLAQLPQMLPFISEGLEDDDDEVETEMQRWIVGIESILGESLTPMLQ